MIEPQSGHSGSGWPLRPRSLRRLLTGSPRHRRWRLAIQPTYRPVEDRGLGQQDGQQGQWLLTIRTILMMVPAFVNGAPSPTRYGRRMPSRGCLTG